MSERNIPIVVGQDSEEKDIIEYVSYGYLVKKRYDDMNERILKGDVKELSMIEIMKPAQDLYNYTMMQLQLMMNANS